MRKALDNEVIDYPYKWSEVDMHKKLLKHKEDQSVAKFEKWFLISLGTLILILLLLLAKSTIR